MQVAVVVFLQFLLYLHCSAVELKVGIYNKIPDLANDNLASYKSMIEKGFNNDDHTVDAVVDTGQYSPYDRKLKDYLSKDGFDLIEMDVADLREVVEDDLIIEGPTNLPDNILPAAVSAVTINRHVYGYPTLVCGNFLIGLKPNTCPLKEARNNYLAFFDMIEKCKASDTYNSKRMLGGKMNDNYGWYLPFIYIDGYIDGYGSVERAVDEVVRGVVDPILCKRLSWFINCCGEDSNKCYYNFLGSYVNDSSNVYHDVQTHETYLYFGFSEKVAKVEQGSDRTSYAAISGPLGEANNLLMFTDALVINKARWVAADEEKKNAIIAFVQYFQNTSLRYDIAMGADLDPPRVRYLLQATEELYHMTDNIIYQDLFWSLSRAVAAPSLTSYQKKKMEEVLTHLCVNISPNEKSRSGKYKEEL